MEEPRRSRETSAGHKHVQENSVIPGKQTATDQYVTKLLEILHAHHGTSI